MISPLASPFRGGFRAVVSVSDRVGSAAGNAAHESGWWQCIEVRKLNGWALL